MKPNPPPYLSTEDAERMLKAAPHKCEACGTRFPVRKRIFNSMMARQLLALASFDHTDPDNVGMFRVIDGVVWVHAPTYLPTLTYKKKNGDEKPLDRECGKLKYWRVTVKRRGKKHDKNPERGYYAVTGRGFKVADGQIRLPKFILTKRREGCIGVYGKRITIDEAFKTHFHYQDFIDGL